MSTLVKTSAMTWPYPLGHIAPGASFASVSVPLTVNIQPCNNDGVTKDNRFNAIWIQASPDNNTAIYICSNANAPDLVAFTNVLGFLLPGQWYPRTKEWANNRDLSTIFIGAANATDFVIASIDAF